MAWPGACRGKLEADSGAALGVRSRYRAGSVFWGEQVSAGVRLGVAPKPPGMTQQE